MKGKNISFGEVLKTKSKNQPALVNKQQSTLVNKQQPKLLQLMHHFQQHPQDNYTLYLNQTTFKSHQSTNQNKSAVFDSWIKKQSIIPNSNKENIRKQQQIHQNYLENRQDIKIMHNKNLKPKETKPLQMDKYHNVESVNNISQRQGKYENRQEKQRIQFRTQPIKNIQSNTLNKQSLQRQFNIITGKKIEQIQKLFSTTNYQNNPKIQALISSTQNIHNEIANLAKKIINQKVSKQTKIIVKEEDQLLLQNLQYPNDIKEQSLKKMESQKKLKQDDQLQRKRWDQAKSLLNGYLEKFQKQKITNDSHKDYRQLKNQPQKQMLNVGFSFAMNLKEPQSQVFQFKQNQNAIDYNSQIKPVQNQKTQDLDQFHNKKNPHLQSSTTNNYIKNIQSIQYHNNYQYQETRVVENMPNYTFSAKLITSQERKHQKHVNDLHSKTLENQNSSHMMEIQEIICNPKKKIDINEEKIQPFSTKINCLPKGHQKISILSSKPKQSDQKSNKTSPTTVNICQRLPQIVTTMFNYPTVVNDKKSVGKTQAYQNDGNYAHENKFISLNPSKKSIKDVKISIISPFQHPLATIPYPSSINTISQSSNSINSQTSLSNSQRNITKNHQNMLRLNAEEKKPANTINDQDLTNKMLYTKYSQPQIQKQNIRVNVQNTTCKQSTIKHDLKFIYRQKSHVGNTLLVNNKQKNFIHRQQKGVQIHLKQTNKDRNQAGQSSEFIFDI